MWPQGGSELHHSGQFLEFRGERSARDCAEMERGVDQAMERCRKKVEVSVHAHMHVCVCPLAHSGARHSDRVGGTVIMILPTKSTSHTAPHLILTAAL